MPEIQMEIAEGPVHDQEHLLQLALLKRYIASGNCVLCNANIPDKLLLKQIGDCAWYAAFFCLIFLEQNIS